jgi:hypothetical protein
MFYTASVANGASNEKKLLYLLVCLKVMLAYSDIGAVPGVADISVNIDIKNC